MSASNDGSISMLMDMGFGRDQAAQALSHCGNLGRAIDFLLNGSVVPGNAGGAGDGGEARAVHSEVSQYIDVLGRSACTSIALTMARKFYDATPSGGDGPEGAIDPTFLGDAVREGISLYGALRNNGPGGVEHSSVEELLGACSSAADANARGVTSTLELLHSSPRQGILSRAQDNPMGLEAVLSQCQADGVGSESHVAVVITKPPETVLVLLPPRNGRPSPSGYVLLDSHPRPQQLAPHRPGGSYALFHATLRDLVSSLEEVFPATELGDDVPEMMAMMYNSFDAYPFRRRGGRR